MTHEEAAVSVRHFAKSLLRGLGYPENESRGDDYVVNLLGFCWAEAVRRRWKNEVSVSQTLEPSVVVAREMMKEDGYDRDLICMLPGMQPMVCKTPDGKQAVCLEQGMGMSMVAPLSAIYTNHVVEATEIARRVASAKVEAPPEPVTPSPPNPPLQWPPQTCWEFFGFDGPVDFETLYKRYAEKLPKSPQDDAVRVTAYSKCMIELAKPLLRAT